MESVTLPVEGVERRYLLATGRVPSGRPVVVFLHGTGSTAAWADGETGWSAVAAREGFALALPAGLPPDPARPPKFLTNPPRWTEGPEDVAFLDAVIADALRRTGGDPRRVYLTGFSNGASMTFRYAAERSEMVAAVAPVAGPCRVPDPRPARPVPTFFVIGTADPLVPLYGGPVRLPWGGQLVRRPPVAESLERWAAALGCSPVPEVVSDADGVRDELYPGPVEFRSVFVAGLGHHWPGGRGQLNPRIGGRPSDDPNANELIWGFFQRHVL